MEICVLFKKKSVQEKIFYKRVCKMTHAAFLAHLSRQAHKVSL